MRLQIVVGVGHTYIGQQGINHGLPMLTVKENKAMAFKWEEPRNPFATEDFRNAIKEATDKLGKELGKIGEQIQVEYPFLTYDDMYTEYGGRMRLNYLNGIGGWQDVLTVLIAHGYVVTAHIEDATETETELENVEKWVVIEFNEVE